MKEGVRAAVRVSWQNVAGVPPPGGSGVSKDLAEDASVVVNEDYQLWVNGVLGYACTASAWVHAS